MIPQFLLTLACFLACLAIEIINPVFSSSLHLSLVSLFLSLAALRTLSICKNFRYIVNCYSVFVVAKQLWEQMNAPAICVATTMMTQSRRCIGCCEVGVATGLGCTVMQPDLWQFQMQPTGLARSGLAWPGLVWSQLFPGRMEYLCWHCETGNWATVFHFVSDCLAF